VWGGDPALEGNAYESDARRFPSKLREAIAALESGTTARAAFGDQVVDHYLSYARTEQALFDQVVTDWERIRYFERVEGEMNLAPTDRRRWATFRQ
jgi:glutamine synthetase